MDNMVKANQVKLVTEIIDNMLYDTSRPWTEFFERLETRTGVARLRLLMGLLFATSTILVVLGANAIVLSNAIGLIYPAQATLSLMIWPPKWQSYTPAAAAVEAQNKKFTYWLTFCGVLIVEQVFGFVLFLFPWYLLLRTLFFIWCFTPIRDNGAAYIYAKLVHKIIEPTRRPHVNPNCVDVQKTKPDRRIRLKCLPPRRSPQKTPIRSALRK